MEAIRKRAGPLHGVLFLALLGLTAAGAWPRIWPLYLLLPLLIYAGIVSILPPLRRTAPQLALGRMTGVPLVIACVLSVATVLALIAFHMLAHPDVSDLTTKLPVSSLGSLILVGVCFSALNAALEELIFRGVLWEVVAAESNADVALIVTAGLFGLFHLHGYPPGPLGAVLAGLFGLALGLLRRCTGGLGLAIACHVCADATIFGLLLWSGAFGNKAP